MRGFLERWLRRAWARRGVAGKIAWLGLLPASFVFRGVVRVRKGVYRMGWREPSRLPIPVLSVGNLSVGGTGKTPTTLWLAQALSARGHRLGILSRGYGGNVADNGVLILDSGSTAALAQGSGSNLLECGDEPAMMSVLYGQTVGVARNRYDSGCRLLDKDPSLEAFVLDDGFQHWRLARDADVVLVGTDWHGSMLPAGPFRECPAALERADAVVVTAEHDRWRSQLDGRFDPARVFFAELTPRTLLSRRAQRWCEAALTSLAGARVLAVSAIANPASFYEMLRDWDADLVDTLEYPDHHRYTNADWHEISRRSHGVDKIITTEKDLVKLMRYPFAKESLFALRVEMVVERQEALLQHICECLFASSRDD